MAAHAKANPAGAMIETKTNIAKNLLNRAHSPDTAASIYEEKIRLRPLLLRPTSPDRAVNARAKRQHERLLKQRAQIRSKKPKPLSAKQKRALCVEEIPKDQRKYAIFEPIHTMWCQYMQEIMGVNTGRAQFDNMQSLGPLLASADYHGALLTVVRSRCPNRIGLTGIVLKDTRFTFELITKADELKIVPKEHTVFRFEVPLHTGELDADSKPAVFEIVGNQFQARAADRATRKFRLHLDQD